MTLVINLKAGDPVTLGNLRKQLREAVEQWEHPAGADVRVFVPPEQFDAVRALPGFVRAGQFGPNDRAYSLKAKYPEVVGVCERFVFLPEKEQP